MQVIRLLNPKQLAELFGADKVKQAQKIQSDYKKNRPELTWILVPCYRREMIAVIAYETLKKGQDDVVGMLLDSIIKHNSQTI